MADKQKAAIALMNLGTAFRECQRILSEMDEKTVKQLISEGYPFSKNFSDTAKEVDEWQQSVRSKIHGGEI